MKPFLVFLGGLCLIEFPLDSWWKILPFLALVSLLLFAPRKSISKQSLLIICGLCLCGFLFCRLFPQPQVELGFNLFTPYPQENIFQKGLPPPVYEDFQNQFLQRFPEANRCRPQVPGCWLEKHQPSSLWAMSPESVWKPSAWTAKRTQVKGSNPRDLRVGAINGLGYKSENTNWYPKNSDLKRTDVPILLTFSVLTPEWINRICWFGSLFSIPEEKNWDPQQIQIYENKTYLCRNPELGAGEPARKKQFFYLVDQTRPNEDFEIQWNGLGSVLVWLDKVVPLLLFAIYVFLIFDIPRLPRNSYKLAALSMLGILASGYLQQFGEVTVFADGDDGLTHAGFGRAILESALHGEWSMAFQGVEQVFYFMPGLRYFRAIESVLFGETSFGYLSLLFFFPGLLFLLGRKISCEKYAWRILIAFLIVMFPGSLVRAAARGFAEGVGYFLFLLGFFLTWNFSQHLQGNKPERSPWLPELLASGFFLSLSIFIRPNLAFAVVGTLGLSVYLLAQKKKLKTLPLLAMACVPGLFALIHNVYFGGRFVLLTSAAEISENLLTPPIVYIQALRSLLNLDFSSSSLIAVGRHLWAWLDPIYFCLSILVWLGWAIKKLGLSHLSINEIYLGKVTFCLQVVLFFWHPGDRYAYLAWIFTVLFAARLTYLLSRPTQGGVLGPQGPESR